MQCSNSVSEVSNDCSYSSISFSAFVNITANVQEINSKALESYVMPSVSGANAASINFVPDTIPSCSSTSIFNIITNTQEIDSKTIESYVIPSGSGVNAASINLEPDQLPGNSCSSTSVLICSSTEKFIKGTSQRQNNKHKATRKKVINEELWTDVKAKKKPEILVQEILAGKMLLYSQEEWATDAAINVKKMCK